MNGKELDEALAQDDVAAVKYGPKAEMKYLPLMLGFRKDHPLFNRFERRLVENHLITQARRQIRGAIKKLAEEERKSRKPSPTGTPDGSTSQNT